MVLSESDRIHLQYILSPETSAKSKKVSIQESSDHFFNLLHSIIRDIVTGKIILPVEQKAVLSRDKNRLLALAEDNPDLTAKRRQFSSPRALITLCLAIGFALPRLLDSAFEWAPTRTSATKEKKKIRQGEHKRKASAMETPIRESPSSESENPEQEASPSPTYFHL